MRECLVPRHIFWLPQCLVQDSMKAATSINSSKSQDSRRKLWRPFLAPQPRRRRRCGMGCSGVHQTAPKCTFFVSEKHKEIFIGLQIKNIKLKFPYMAISFNKECLHETMQYLYLASSNSRIERLKRGEALLQRTLTISSFLSCTRYLRVRRSLHSKALV